MKKSLIFAFAAVAVLAGCSNGGQKISTVADYQAYLDGFNSEFQQGLVAIQSDTTLTEDQKNENANSFYESKLDELTKTGIGIIKAHPSDSLALVVYQDISGFLEDDQNAEVLKLFKGAIAESDFVVNQKAVLEAVEKTKEGNPFVDFTVVQDYTDVEGSTVRFSDYIGKGKFVLVDFWASWCGPCKREIPNIKAVYDEFAGDKFDVLSVAVWDEPADTKAAAVEHNVVWNQIINAQRIPTDLYGIKGIPQIMLFSPDGTILKRDLRGEAIREAVAAALAD